MFPLVKVANANGFLLHKPTLWQKKKAHTQTTAAGGKTWHSQPSRFFFQHLWHTMKAAQWKFSLPLFKCAFLKMPDGMYWHSAHAEIETVAWSHSQIIKICRVLKTFTINKNNDIIRAYGLTSLAYLHLLLQCGQSNWGICEGEWLELQVSSVRRRWMDFCFGFLGFFSSRSNAGLSEQRPCRMSSSLKAVSSCLKVVVLNNNI